MTGTGVQRNCLDWLTLKANIAGQRYCDMLPLTEKWTANWLAFSTLVYVPFFRYIQRETEHSVPGTVIRRIYMSLLRQILTRLWNQFSFRISRICSSNGGPSGQSVGIERNCRKSLLIVGESSVFDRYLYLICNCLLPSPEAWLKMGAVSSLYYHPLWCRWYCDEHVMFKQKYFVK